MVHRRRGPFLERIRRDRKTGELVEELSLRERFPTYLKAFGLGLVVTGLLGLGLFAVTELPVGEALGYSWIFSGTILLLAGGARGGGYSNLSVGALEAMVGGRNRSDDDFEGDAEQRQGKTMRRRDPMERLRRGLRPPPNPSAFWQIIAGFGYIALGLPLTL
jgi:hypothetical protein